MGARFHLSGVTPIDASGNTYPLATIDFYITGTTTRTNTYSDAGLTSANANPVTLGSDGRIPEIFTTQVRTKCVFKDVNGATISGLSFDPIDKSLEEVRGSGKPSPAYPGLRCVDTSTSPAHRFRRSDDNTTWIDEGAVDSLGNASTVTQALAATDTASFLTPAAGGATWVAGTDIAAGATLSLPSTGGGVFNITGASTTISAMSSAAQGREVELIIANAQTITHGSGINTLTGETTKLPAGARLRLRRDASAWSILWWTLGPFQGLGGANGLVVTNNASTPNTKIDVTADAAVLESATNAWCVKHTAVSITINLGATGANGLDTGAQAVSTWYNVWLISDGVTVAGLASTSATSPTMPSGYKYKLRVGAMRSDASTTLLRTKQVGRRTRYIVGATTNVLLLPLMVSPASSQSHTAIVVAAFVPPTAVEIGVAASCETTANAWITIAPNADAGYVATLSPIAGPGIMLLSGHVSGQHIAATADIALESTSIYYSSGSATNTHASVNACGWTDKVAA